MTLEAVTFGLVTGLNLLVLLLLFEAFGAGVDYAALLRFVPGFLFRAGLVTSIALTFVPQTLRTFRDVREAQMIRGHRFHSWRDLAPLMVPVVVIGLERSVQLAEAMESRGFGGPTGATDRLKPRLALLLGIASLLLGLGLRSLWDRPWPVAGLVLAGGSLLVWGFRHMGRRVRRTRYRLYSWTRADVVLAVAGGVLAGSVLAARLWAPEQLLYYPYPRVMWPVFSPWLGVLFALVATPALLVPPEEEHLCPP
ncbi:MAG: energy-coupling factor transporter transmembrane component T [Ardenticatenia bacterium]|nr:energy-coupling factor transporter transmembrane component T [Ardenticatenia bacterium]